MYVYCLKGFVGQSLAVTTAIPLPPKISLPSRHIPDDDQRTITSHNHVISAIRCEFGPKRVADIHGRRGRCVNSAALFTSTAPTWKSYFALSVTDSLISGVVLVIISSSSLKEACLTDWLARWRLGSTLSIMQNKNSKQRKCSSRSVYTSTIIGYGEWATVFL